MTTFGRPWASGALVPVLIGGFILALCVGCTDDDSDDATVPTVQNPQDKETAGAVFDEKRMTAALHGTQAHLELALGHEGQGAIEGKIVVTLKHLDGTAVGDAEVSFNYGTEGKTLALVIDGLPADTTKPQLAAYVLDYHITWNGGESEGRRSLFDALRKLEVILITEDRIETKRGGHFALFALDPSTAEPIMGAEVKAWLQTEEGEKLVAEATTDEAGNASADIPTEEGVVGDGTLRIEVTGNGAVETAELGVSIVRDQKVLLTTDKPRYQPGQLMHIRALALHAGDKLPESGRELIFEIEDAKGNKIAREKATTDEFGIASTKIQLANELNMGKWTVRAMLGETKSEKTLTVERYTLPKFKTTVSMDSPWYAPGDTVTVSGDSVYFFGKPVAGGTVHIVASTFDVEFTPFAELSTTTNEEGLFTATFDLPSYVTGTALEQGKGVLKVDIEVVDQAGQKLLLSKSAPVAEGGIEVALVPESGDLAVGLKNEIFVLTTDPMGEPMAATVTLSQEGTEIASLETGASGLGSFTMAPLTATTVLDVTATSGDESVTVTRTLNAGSDTAAVLLRTDKTVYAVGDTVTVEARVGENQERLYLDVVHGGRTVDLEVVEVTDGIGAHAFDLDSSHQGDVLVSVYYVSSQGTLVRDQKLIYVQGNGGLDVKFSADKSTYLPGDPAKVSIHVADADGNGVAAAVGVQIVDEAVFALQEIQPGLLKVFFDLQKELAEPHVTLHGADYSASDIIASPTPAAETDQAKARVAFAALVDSAPHSVQTDTFKGAVTEMHAVLAPFVTAEKDRIKGDLGDLARSGAITWENLEDYLELQLQNQFDFWNRPYAIEVNSETQQVTVTSNGPDERAGTLDDLSFQMSYHEVIYGDTQAVPGAFGERGDFAAADADEDGMVNGGGNNKSSGSSIKVRDFFPETLYVNPAIITGPDGLATFDVDMADSITEWRVTGLASSQTGLLGSGTGGITVFQDFFVDIDFPVAITRNDAFSVPVAIYNYLDEAQTVTLTVEPSPWVEISGGGTQTITLGPGEVTGASFDIKAVEVGVHGLTIVAQGTKMSDAVKRTVDVRPDGKAFEETHSARFASGDDPAVPVTDTVAKTISIPELNIDGAQRVTVKVYPGFLSQVVEGMDSMLRLPGG